MVREERFLRGPAMRITIQVAMHNVQVMRSPLSGIVRVRRYEPGDPTRQSDDSLWLGINCNAARIAMRQVANRRWRRLPFHWIRRIVCWADLEESLQAGQVIGHLTLGGAAEVYVPCTATIRARAGQPVIGGVTVLATLPLA
jgi:phosphatidylserine decarboxylase